VCVPSCGNAEIDADEQCDDGNLMADDGCTPSCTIEAGYICQGSPSVCCLDSNADGQCDQDFEFYAGGDGACYCKGIPTGSHPQAPLSLFLLLCAVLSLTRRFRRRG
jgi:cysteine-rich repeat protein